GKATSAQISMAKRNNVDMAIRIAREARQVLGGMGITGEYSIMRHSMNLESVITYEGTHDIHLLDTGFDITGENAFQYVLILILLNKGRYRISISPFVYSMTILFWSKYFNTLSTLWSYFYINFKICWLTQIIIRTPFYA